MFPFNMIDKTNILVLKVLSPFEIFLFDSILLVIKLITVLYQRTYNFVSPTNTITIIFPGEFINICVSRLK